MELKEALAIAIDYEHAVQKHYATGAEQVLDPRGKKVFQTLAREEAGHIAYLRSRLDEWTRGGAVQTPELPTVLPTAEWIAQAKDRVAKGPSPTVAVHAELELLKVALELERTTSAFYQQLVGTVEAQYRPLFSRFLEIEQGHLAIVQAEIDSITGTGTWFDFMEISLEAG
ncbi:MAG: ferritin family protein [Thermoanaerobaculaceae bacterium]|nr:ferritin family protein [Thermoanaerobaculaceae bacterium]